MHRWISAGIRGFNASASLKLVEIDKRYPDLWMGIRGFNASASLKRRSPGHGVTVSIGYPRL